MIRNLLNKKFRGVKMKWIVSKIFFVSATEIICRRERVMKIEELREMQSKKKIK